MKKKNKTSIFVAAATAMCFILLGFQVKKYAVQTVSLKEAIDQKLVTADFISNGGYSGGSVICRLRNLSDGSLKIIVPAGTYLRAPHNDEQNLIIPQEKMISMGPRSNAEQVLDGFCTEARDQAPQKGGVFALSEHRIPKMNELLPILKNGSFSNAFIQSAVWSITDGHSVAAMNAGENTALKSVRTQISKIAGQPDPWYTAPRERSVGEDRRIRNEAVSVSGDLVFNSKKGSKIYQELTNASGVVLWKMNETAILYDGEVRYKFSIKVQGWEKGKYTVLVKEGRTVIKTFEFEV